jgi:hypothetical protein
MPIKTSTRKTSTSCRLLRFCAASSAKLTIASATRRVGCPWAGCLTHPVGLVTSSPNLTSLDEGLARDI